MSDGVSEFKKWLETVHKPLTYEQMAYSDSAYHAAWSLQQVKIEKLQLKLIEAKNKIECIYPDIIDGHCNCSNCEFIRNV